MVDASSFKVREYMTSTLYVVSPHDTIARARRLMLDYNVTRLLVVEEGRAVGMLSITDILKKIIETSGPAWRVRPIDDMLVSRVASTGNIVTVTPNSSIKRAAEIMIEKGVSGVPVEESGRLIGMITKTDITRFYSENARKAHRVRDLMKTKLVTIRPNQTIYRATKKMIEHNVKRLIVTDSGGKLIGILTMRDVAFAQMEMSESPERGVLIESESGRRTKFVRSATVEEIMRKDVSIITEIADAARAARKMIEEGIGGIPVVERDRMVKGIITKTDITRAVSEWGR